MNGLKHHGIKFDKAAMFGRHIASLGDILPKSFTGKAIRDAAIQTGINPLDPRRIIETADQWPHLTLEEQHTVLASFQDGVSLILLLILSPSFLLAYVDQTDD